MEVNEMDIRNAAEWQAIVTQDRNADFLQSFEWAMMLKVSYGFEPHFLEFKEGRKQVGCVLVVGNFGVSRDRGIKNQVSNKFNRSFSRSFICYNGPAIFDVSKADSVMDALMAWLNHAAKSQSTNEAKFTLFKYNLADINSDSLSASLAAAGFREKKWGTYLVDLNQSEESLWEYIGKSARKSLKKARESDITVNRVADHDEYLEKFIRPYNRMEREHGRTGVSTDTVYRTRDLDYINKCYHYYYAESKGVVHGIIGMCTYNGWAMEITSASSRYAQENHLYVQDLLHWQMFLDAKNIGCHTFDMAGVNPEPKSKKEEGINQFKKKWGGRYTEYPIFERQNRSILARLRTIPGKANRIMRGG